MYENIIGGSKNDPKSGSKFSQLYAVYYYPCMILPIFSGYAVDKIGLAKTLTIFTATTIVGHLIMTMTAFISNPNSLLYSMTLFGKFIFGIGKESVAICTLVPIYQWFFVQEYALAMGIYLTIIRCGSVSNNYLTPSLANFGTKGLGLAFLAGFIILIMSFICGLVFLKFEKRATRTEYLGVEANLRQSYHLELVRKFDPRFWLISFNIMFAYIGFECFYDILREYLESKFSKTSKNDITDTLVSLNYIVPIIFSLILGYITDRFGRKITLMTIATLMLSISHIILLTIPNPNKGAKSYLVVIPFSIIGLGYGMYAVSAWTLIPIVSNPACLGTAYGIVLAIQNLGQSITPIIVHFLTKNHEDNDPNEFDNAIIYYMVSSIIAFILNIILYIYDKISIIRVRKRTRRYYGRLSSINND